MMMKDHYEACTHLHRTIQADTCSRHEGRRYPEPFLPSERSGRHHLRCRHGAADERKPWIRRTEDSSKTPSRRRHDCANSSKKSGSQALIEVDGGVQGETAPRLVKAGVNVLVSGSYVFKSEDPLATIHSLKELEQIED